MKRALRRLATPVAAVAALLGSLARAEAVQISVVSNTGWRQSTQVETNDTHPGWPGSASLPSPVTYTVPTSVYTNVHVANVAGSTSLFSGSGVRYYRTTFALPAFSSVAADVRVSVDNDVQILINGHELALVGSLDMRNFLGPPHLQTYVGADGSVINGANGGDAFDRVAPSFPSSNWVSGGDNELVLVVRNLSGGDTGGLSFAMTIEAAPPANRPPVANSDAVTTGEDTPVNVAVMTNDTDPDGDALAVTGLTQAANGAVALAPNGTVTYTPKADYSGSDAFTYALSDGRGGTATGTVTVSVTAVNDAPATGADSAAVLTRGLVTVNVTRNDRDADGDALTVTGVSAPAYGTAEIVDNQVRYRSTSDRLPAYDDSFTYTVSDGNGGSATGAVRVKVAARLPLISVPKPLAIREGMPLRFTVKAKDPNVLPPAALPTAINTKTMPRGASFRNSTLTWTPLFNQAGRYRVLFGARTTTTPSRAAVKAVDVAVKENRYPNLIVGGQPLTKKVRLYTYRTVWETYAYWYWADVARFGRNVPGYTGSWHWRGDAYGNSDGSGMVVAQIRQKVPNGTATVVAAGEKVGFEIRRKHPVTGSSAFQSFGGGLLRSWRLPVPPYSGYAKSSGITRPAVGNVDGTQLSEVVVGAGPGSGGLLTAYSPTGKWTKSYRIAWPAYAKANGETWPAVGDLGRDGKAEITVGFGRRGGGRINVLGWTAGRIGSKGWLKIPDVNGYNATNGTTRPAVGDLTGDHRAEIAIGVDGGGATVATRVWIWTPSGSSYRPLALQLPAVAGLDSARFNCETWPAIGDVDGDGTNELVVNVTRTVGGVRKPVGFGVWSFKLVNGRLQARLRAFKKASTFGPPALGDVFTPDGRAEIVLREAANRKTLSVFKVAVAANGKWTIARAGSVSTGQRNPCPAFGKVAP